MSKDTHWFELHMRAIYLFIVGVLLFSCETKKVEEKPWDGGKLMIIGGGKRPPALIERLVDEAGIKSEGYGLILPMSSIEPDSSIFYALKQFDALGLSNVKGMYVTTDSVSQDQLDSLANANMIYISGGDQNRFMKRVEGSLIVDMIKRAYEQGAMIAGTSAGAAMMSEVMITGDERRYPDYNETFRNIESENIATANGLGLLKTAVIDQHFIKRSRYNRLISAVIERPDLMGIGIDESTAILVEGTKATVVGESQVILLKSGEEVNQSANYKMGQRGMELSVLLPGDTFTLELTK